VAEGTLLEVSLLVDGEMAEAVADVLARFIPNGVVIESTQIAPDPDGEGHVTGPLKVFGYLPIDSNIETLRGKIQESLWYLSRIRPLPELEFRYLAEANWVESWKEHYQPIPVGKRLLIIPAWLTPPDGPRAAVRIDPGMAFGTGTHPTTQLCLQIAESRIRLAQPVIDIGCGSGILSIAALKLGASKAIAVDIDPLAVQATRQNATLNGVETRIELATGSVAEVRAGKTSRTSAPLVFANILAPILVELFELGLADLIEPDGVGILSGILEEQTKSVENAALGRGFQTIERRQLGDWVALGVSRNQ
jgi:ribosomal protein L11 methyltransferase